MGGGRGDHAGFGAARRVQSQPLFAGSGLEICDGLQRRDRDGAARNHFAVLCAGSGGIYRRAAAWLVRAERKCVSVQSGAGQAVCDVHPDRLWHQSRSGADAHLAAGCPQPGADAGQRTVVRRFAECGDVCDRSQSGGVQSAAFGRAGHRAVAGRVRPVVDRHRRAIFIAAA